MENNDFYERVLNVQAELKAPKGQYNNFGKYSYRSCEDILEAAKPLLVENKLLLNVSDCLVEIGGRNYIKAVAAIYDTGSDEFVTSTAFAREPESKKGMDESQITGCASSYARKYALNGLLLIDDTRDADTMDNRDEQPKYDKRKSMNQNDDAELRLAQSRCKAALQAVAERDGFDPKLAWKGIQQRNDYENTPGFWTARAVEYEMS